MPLVSQLEDAGDYSIRIGKQNLSGGIYLIRLNEDDKSVLVKKFVLVN